MQRDWKEIWVDKMGLIVALAGEERFKKIREFKEQARYLTAEKYKELQQAIKERFTPTNGQDGCSEAISSVKEVI